MILPPNTELEMPLASIPPPTVDEVYAWYRAEADARMRDKLAFEARLAVEKAKADALMPREALEAIERKLTLARDALERIAHPHHSRTAATPPSWVIASEALETTQP